MSHQPDALLFADETDAGNSEALMVQANEAFARGNHELAAAFSQAAGLFAIASAIAGLDATTQAIADREPPP